MPLARNSAVSGFQHGRFVAIVVNRCGFLRIVPLLNVRDDGLGRRVLANAATGLGQKCEGTLFGIQLKLN